MDKERKREYNRRYAQAHREEFREKARIYRQNNREAIVARTRERRRRKRWIDKLWAMIPDSMKAPEYRRN